MSWAEKFGVPHAYHRFHDLFGRRCEQDQLLPDGRTPWMSWTLAI